MNDDIQNNKDRTVFLTGLGLLLTKYNMTWDDIDIDLNTHFINIKAEIIDEQLFNFIEELKGLTGGELI